jgi:hypothetical protein
MLRSASDRLRHLDGKRHRRDQHSRSRQPAAEPAAEAEAGAT